MKRNKIYAWMAAAMTLAACSTNDIADITANDADNIVNIASVTRSGEGGTATSTMTAPFHLVNVTQQTNYGWKCEADYTYNSSTSQYARKDGDLVVWCNIKSDNSSEQMVANEFQAFSPLRTVANEASYTTFQILPDQSTAEKLAAADWMTATKTLTKLKADNSVNSLDLNFEHKNAKLHFDVTINDEANGITANDITVIGGIKPYYNSGDNTIEAIVEPVSDLSTTTDKLIQIKISDDETLAASFPSNLTSLSPGKQYNFSLSIGHNKATISSVSVTDWNNSSIDLNGHDDALTIPYITFTSNEEVGFKMESFNNYTISGLEYSVNNGNWTSISGSGMSEAVTFGGTKGNLRLRGKNLYGTATNEFSWSNISFSSNETNAKVACTGDIRTLLDYSNYKNVNTSNARFCNLFKDCKILTSAPELPATKLANRCYYYMFKGCTSLTTAPELPAKTLAEYCYYGMFLGCTALTTAPELPAETLARSCYNGMFGYCTSLTKSPELKAEKLYDYCYSYMFQFCTSLTKAPELKAETLTSNCCSYMFYGCTALTKAPELKATTLAEKCYSYMFNGCTKLKSVTMLATDVSANQCLYNWLGGSAGTEASSRTLTVANQDAYNAIKNNLPDIWQSGEGKATVIYKDGNTQ
ncbi:MAG: fimbrillin family protein [Prevotella sp.]